MFNCSDWATASLPLPGDPTTIDNFTATASVDPDSIAYQSVNPLTGRLLLTPEEYGALAGGLLYVVMYRENDGAENGRVRGAVGRSSVPSVIGGMVFEYTDEWWKGMPAAAAPLWDMSCGFIPQDKSTCRIILLIFSSANQPVRHIECGICLIISQSSTSAHGFIL